MINTDFINRYISSVYSAQASSFNLRVRCKHLWFVWSLLVYGIKMHQGFGDMKVKKLREERLWGQPRQGQGDTDSKTDK